MNRAPTVLPARLAETRVSFPSGSMREVARVEHVVPDVPLSGGRFGVVITDLTPFHPEDPLWPDQPADHGVVRTPGFIRPVRDTVVLAVRPGGPLMIGDGVQVRRDEPGVLFLVGHVVDADVADELATGTEIELVVDGDRRRRLSAAHTACHMLAYALNERTHGLWRKPAATDSRGHHDLDAASCVSTRHHVGGSVDHYRLGRSLRRLGFSSASLVEALPEVMADVNRLLASWVEARSTVTVKATGPLLTDRRQWTCELPQGVATMPCGGTHVRSLGDFRSIIASANHDAETSLLQIRTDAELAP